MAVAGNIQAVQSRLAHHYLEKLRSLQKIYERGGDSVYTALSQFEQEWPQIQRWQAWSVAHAQDDPQAAALCYEYPEAAFDLLNLRQNPPERVQWLETGLAAARQLGSLEGETDILLTLVAAYDGRGETSLAEEYVQQSLALAYQLQDQRRLALAFHRLGMLQVTKGDFTRAQEYQDQALTIFQTLGDRRNTAHCLHRLGIVHLVLGHYPESSDYLKQCAPIWQRLGDMNRLAYTIATLGQVSQYEGEYAIAQGHYEHSIMLARSVGNKTLTAGVLNDLGIIAHIQGDLAAAQHSYEEALAIYKEIGSRYGVALSFANLAIIATDQGDYLTARRYEESALEGYRAVGHISYVMGALGNLTSTLIQLGEIEAAIRTVHESLILVKRHPGIKQVLIVLSATQVFTTLGRFEEAAVLAGLALYHPTARQDHRDTVEGLRPKLDAALGADAVNAAFEHGKTLDIEAALADLLPKFEALDPQYVEN